MERGAEYGLSLDTSTLIMLRHVLAGSKTSTPLQTEAMPGPIAMRRQGRGSESDDIRVWSFGDDIRHIDRNSTARTGVPHVKTFRDEREQTTLLMADFRPPMLFGTRRVFMSVAAAELLCLYGWQAAAAGGRVGLLAFGCGEPVYVRPKTGSRGMLDVIGGMARAYPADANGNQSAPTLDGCIDMAARLMPRSGTAILASSLDERGGAFEDSVRRLLHRANLKIALVQDAFKDRAPRGSFPFVTMRGVTGIKRSSGGKAPLPDDPELNSIRHLGARMVRFPADTEPHGQLFGLRELHDGFG
jgi:uncharacterized protein (DUF58 family)